MQDLGGKTVILRTYEAAVHTYLFDDVFVVTDSDLIFDEFLMAVKPSGVSKNTSRAVINCGSCFESRSVL
jgi:CMP-N-acetylneuraminic acid synthetase